MRIARIVLLGLALLGLPFASPAADASPKIGVLIITGDDVNVHPWHEVAEATRELLEASGRFMVRVCDDPGVLESAASLQRYQVIYLSMYNQRTPTLTGPAKENLLGFVRQGKGFVVTHLSSASFKEWDEFKTLCGRNWVMGKSGHGPRSPFACRIADPDHPITRGVSPFETDDELYAKLQGDAPIHVLVTADSDFSKKTEPLAFTLTYGQGRVFHHTFGHDRKALDNPSLRKLISQGTEWVATGRVQ